MTQTENTTESRKGKHLNYQERLKIEAWKQLDKPLSNREIARKLGRVPQTIHTEIKDGYVRQIRRQVQNGKTYEYESFCYSASAGQAAYEKARENSRKQAKWVNAPDFMAYADHQMEKEKQSPDIVVGRAKKLGLFSHEDIPCTTTLYNYIDLCLMKTRNIDLHLKLRRNRKTPRNRKNKTILGELIEKRPDIVTTRERFGDWEIDTVNGLRVKDDQALLTLTERKTRYEVIIKIDGKASNPVNQAVQTLKEAAGKHFDLLFKTITSDNGTEFSGLSNLLKDITDVYFTHPYSSWERGTNENHNGMIRRFIPKGTRMSDVSLATVRRVQDWMNNLPRRILGYATPRECLLEEMAQLSLTT
ncbi:IS30 family transposase [Enterococcus sp. CWB-B31]|uniref:IS30 family transposase n=1 Tax=Enterococcus sp. CWB-B31 TaxID=2885159 RepID=UPI001E54D27D|nr:IS30 family transposase [Enterococcus sp. CWB-B31]MCB5955546.1 IS30 family transposase [Enterococcus sp. CWB-B31]